MQHQALLENYLKQLHLSTFLQNYQAYAQDAARTDLPYERYLLALCAAEVNQRDVWRVERAIQAAKFPVLKDLASFDFDAAQNISKQRVLELAESGAIWRQRRRLFWWQSWPWENPCGYWLGAGCLSTRKKGAFLQC